MTELKVTFLGSGDAFGSGAPSYALRVETAGKTVVYSGDTEWSDILVNAVDGADLFICETYYYDKRMKNHMTYKDLVKHRGDLNCRRIIATHMSQDLLDRRAGLKLECAADGKVVTV